MKFERYRVVLLSGIELYQHADLLSPSEDGEVAYGYDGHLSLYDEDKDFGACEILAPGITEEDMRDLADTMIARWQAWKARFDAPA